MQPENGDQIAFHVDPGQKERAEKLFERIGVNMDTVLNAFLHKVVDGGASLLANGSKDVVFGSDCSPADITSAFVAAVKTDIAENRRKGLPVAGYDAATKRAYLEAVDGTREYVNA